MTMIQMTEVLPGHYRHYGGGNYTVLAVGRNSTNKDDGRPMVAYFSWTTGNLCFRDLEEWMELVPWPDGVTRPRFCRAEEVPAPTGTSGTSP